MPKVKIYMTDNCPYCVRAKRFFTEHSIAFSEVNLTNNFTEIQRLKEQYHWQTVPMIFIGETFIGGYTDMMEKHHSGELKKLLA